MQRAISLRHMASRYMEVFISHYSLGCQHHSPTCPVLNAGVAWMGNRVMMIVWMVVMTMI